MSRRECLVGGICRTGSHAYNDERYPLDAMSLPLSAPNSLQTRHGDDFISILNLLILYHRWVFSVRPSPSFSPQNSPPRVHLPMSPASFCFSLSPLPSHIRNPHPQPTNPHPSPRLTVIKQLSSQSLLHKKSHLKNNLELLSIWCL